MKVIGLTGQTGAGKSTLSDFAKKLGFAVVTADSVAREAVMPGTDCLKRLAEFFGYDIIDDGGNVIRPLLAERAFSSQKSTEMLNSITHPWIIERCSRLLEEYSKAGFPAAVLDASQLYESHGEGICDFVIAVVAENAPDEILEDVEYYANLSEIPFIVYDGTSVDLGSVCGKPFTVATLIVNDPGDSTIL